MKIGILSDDREASISIVEPDIQTRSAVSSLNLGIWSIDISTGSLMVCKRCREILPMLGERRASINSFKEIIATGHQKRFEEIYLLSKQTGCQVDFDFPLMDRDGPFQKWLRITAGTCESPGTLHRIVCGTLEDISERKFVEQTGRDFLSIASHDLQSPLTVIKLYLQMCRHVPRNINSDCVAGILEKADRQINRMSKIIQGFLQISALETGELSLCKEHFDMKDLLNEVVDDFLVINPAIRFMVKCRPCGAVYADRDKIFQVVQNLLGNAIKYSPGLRKVIIRLRQRGNNIMLGIKDFGIGIKAADRRKIFDRFYRIQQERNKGIQGYGIGLFISRKIVLQHQGEIWVKSREGSGSAFYFTLPIK
jgi:signal transduction histidine kinase